MRPPNLQDIPVRTELAAKIRAAFLDPTPRAGQFFSPADIAAATTPCPDCHTHLADTMNANGMRWCNSCQRWLITDDCLGR